MTETWPLSVVILALLAFLAWREWLYQRQIKDLTSKIKAGSIYEYQTVMEDAPKKEKKEQDEKQKTVSDPVLGPTY